MAGCYLVPGARVRNSSRRPRTSSAIDCAAATGGSCSHTRTGSHPAARNLSSVSRSRRRLPSIFSFQNAAFALGQVAWMGHPCQKHPSTYTAIRRRENTTSARRRRPGRGLWSTRYRRPCRWSSLRSASSGAVSRCGVACIRRWALGEEGAGVPFRRVPNDSSGAGAVMGSTYESANGLAPS